MKRSAQLTVFSILFLSVALVYQNCGKSFRSQTSSQFSSSCRFNKAQAPFEQTKVHISSAWFKGVRKASPEAQQLIVTVDTACLRENLAAQKFINHSFDFKKIPQGMKKYAFAFDFPSIVDEALIKKVTESNPCILGLTEQKAVRSIPFQSAATSVTDPRVFEQTALDFLGFDDSLEMREATDKKVIVAVIDSGINYNHIELASQMWRGRQGEMGYNFIDNNNFPLDDDGHGTHVAGIIAAQANNNVGIAGLASDQVQLMAVKVLDQNGDGNVQGVYNGIIYAINNGAEIINLSIEARGTNPLIEQGVAEAVRAGVLVTMAAGNASEQLSSDNLFAPAYIGPAYAGAISVASVDVITEQRSSFSNYSPQYLEMAAPGAYDTLNDIGILSTYGDSYSRIKGTSQATPMISAGAALLMAYLKSRNVGYSPSSVEAWLKGKGKRSVPALLGTVEGGDLLDLKALADNTMEQYPVNNSGTSNELPGSTSTGSALPANCSN